MSNLTGKIISGGAGAGTERTSYAVSELIAQNGKTFLYKAVQSGTNQDVLIKYFQLDEIDPETAQKIRAKFEEEAQILIKINHPNMADAIAYGYYQENPFLVMKFVRGKSIENRLGKPVPAGEAAKILGPVSRALNYANKKGVKLRDIHPGNIWVNPLGESILLAYCPPSPAEILQPAAADVSSAIFTRPDYVAPEAWLGKVSEQSDVYSLGLVTYELVTGQKWFQSNTPEAVIAEQAAAPLPQPLQFVPDLSEDMQRVIANAMAVNTEERYPDAAKMAIVFERVSHRETAWFAEQLRDKTAENKTKKLLPWIIVGAVAVVAVILIVVLTSRKPASTAVAAATPTAAITSEAAGGETDEGDEVPTQEPTQAFQPTKKASAGEMVGNVYVGSQEEAIQAFENGVPSVESLIEDFGSNPQQSYTLNLQSSQPLLWVSTWCATTEEILDQNLAKLTYSFTINGLPIKDSNIVERRYTRDSDQLLCADKMILLDQFKPGREKLVLKRVSQQVINNGVEDTPPRQYYERITIEIGE